jgi:hypothetical protein
MESRSSSGPERLICCKFTAKERDTESGNDYFGARYYGGWPTLDPANRVRVPHPSLFSSEGWDATILDWMNRE